MIWRWQNQWLAHFNMWYSCQGWQGWKDGIGERSLNWRRRRSVDRWEISWFEMWLFITPLSVSWIIFILFLPGPPTFGIMGDCNPGWNGTVHFTNRSRTGQAKKQNRKPPQKNTTIMTTRPTILHSWLYFSAYTPPPLAIDGMADSPIFVRQYGVGGLAGYVR